MVLQFLAEIVDSLAGHVAGVPSCRGLLVAAAVRSVVLLVAGTLRRFAQGARTEAILFVLGVRVRNVLVSLGLLVLLRVEILMGRFPFYLLGSLDGLVVSRLSTFVFLLVVLVSDELLGYVGLFDWVCSRLLLSKGLALIFLR